MGDAMAIMDMEMGQGGDGGSSASAGMKKERAQNRRSRGSGAEGSFKRPEGMHRELYALLCSDNKDHAPIIPTDVVPPVGGVGGGYKQIKAKLGLKKVRPWIWMPFVNPGRQDSFKLYHWRRKVDEGKEYPFGKFSKSVQIQSYSDAEYNTHLQTENWTKAETDHLMDLCRLFDLRFLIIHDRWNRERFQTPRSVEDLKERYYNICNTMIRVKTPPGQELKLKGFDAAHERKRKDQLIKLYNRTPEQIEEEQDLLEELRKIEMRKKEREKKTQDLQKLITAADSSTISRKVETPGPGRPPRGPGRKKISGLQRVSGSKESAMSPGITTNVLEAGIKFPEIKSAGPSLRSQRMKLPASVGQKKSKAIEQLLQELNIDLRPMPTEEIAVNFNELRSDMVLLYELKMALANCEFELQTLKHQRDVLQPGAGSSSSSAGVVKTPSVIEPQTPSTPATPTVPPPLKTITPSKPEPPSPAAPVAVSASSMTPAAAAPLPPGSVKVEAGHLSQQTPTGQQKQKGISEVLEVSPHSVTPVRKRRAALEQQQFLRKVKKT